LDSRRLVFRFDEDVSIGHNWKVILHSLSRMHRLSMILLHNEGAEKHNERKLQERLGRVGDLLLQDRMRVDIKILSRTKE